MARHRGPRTRFRTLLALLGVFALLFMGLVTFTGSASATGGGNEDCPEGTTLLAKYNWNGSGYVAESGGTVVSVSGNTTSGTFTVTSDYVVSAVVVKGGTNAKTDIYDPPVTSGSFNNTGLVNNGGQTAGISNVKFCGGVKPPTDACPDLPGDQPMGTDCTQPEDDRQTRDLPGVVDCQDETYTVEHQERTREYSWDGDSWEPGPWSDWTTYDTTVTPATDEQCPDEPPTDACPDLPGDQPMGTDCTQPEDDRQTRDLPGVVDCQDETYTVEHQERTREYSWDGDSWEPGPWSDWTTYDTTVTPATDEQCPDEPADENDGLCHATGSATNPYVFIENISSAGIYNGHFDEDGPGPEAPGDHQNNADIIPPFTYQGETYSQNWDAAGQAIYNAGCKVEDDEEEPEGTLSVTSNCESITFSASGVKPEGAEVVFKLDGVTKAPGTYPVAPGSHTVELFVDGNKVDSETITVAECEDGQVTPAGFTLTNPTCAANGSLLIPAQPEGVLVTPAPGTYGPGTYSVVFTAADGFVLTTNPSGAVTVLTATGYQDEDKSAACYVEREPDVRETSDERENCRLGGVETTHAVYTTSYSFNEETQAWESSETATSSLSFEPYTAAELHEKGCVKGPDDNPDNPDTPPTNTPTTADTGLWTEGATSENRPVLLGTALALVLMSLGFLSYGARRRGQES